MIKENILENGLKIISYQKKSNPLVSIQLYIRIGTAQEKDNESGFAHLTEHLVFKSTKKYPNNKIMETAAWLGGNINAYTEYDSTCFYITLPSNQLEKGMEIISELGINANFSNEEFYNEKQIVIQEKNQYDDDPEDSFVETIAKTYFQKNRYGKPILGETKSLNSAKPEELRKFYKKYYRPNNAFLLVSGDFEEDKLLQTVKKYFGDWKQKKVVKIPYYQDSWKSGFHFIKKNIEDDYLAFVFPELSGRDFASYPLSAALNIFAGGKKSRLYKRLFIKEQLIDGIKIHSLAGINNGISIIIIIPKNGADLEKIIDIFNEELQKIRQYGFSLEELSDYKKVQIFNFRYSSEFVEAIAMSIGMEEVLSTYKNYEKYPEFISAITLENIKASVSKYLSQEKLFIYQMGKRKLNYKPKKNILATTKILPKKIWETQISSGTKIVFKKSENSETVGIVLSLPISQFNETKENLGINSTTLTMLMYGNEKRNYEQFLNYSRENGIAISVSSRTDASMIKIKCFKEDIHKAITLLADMIFTPVFPKQHFENIKNTHLSLFKKIKNYPQYYALKLWREFFFGKNSNLIASEGTSTTIKNLSLKKIKEWYKKHYIPQNMNIAVVGDFDFNQVYSYLEELFNPIKHFEYKLNRRIIEERPKKNYKEKVINLTQAYINMGGKSVTLNDKNHTAFSVLSQILGGNADPILFKEIREKRSWAYSVDFDFVKTDLTGYFLINAIVEKKYYKQTIEVIKEILTRKIDENLISYYLPKIKTYIKGQRILDEESVLSQAISLSYILSINKDYTYYRNWEKRLEAVTVESILEVANRYFIEENLFTYILR